jgi:UDP-N-acetyl-D-glucosamine dehydrogenase
MTEYSTNPAGERFPLPEPPEYAAEFARLAARAAAARAAGQEVVVVMGVGFVGAVMAAIVADSTGKNGQPGKFVIGSSARAAGVTGRSPCSIAASLR